MKTPAELVRELRGNMTKAEFAAKIGASKSYLAIIESGGHPIGLKFAVKLAKFSGRPLTDFWRK